MAIWHMGGVFVLQVFVLQVFVLQVFVLQVFVLQVLGLGSLVFVLQTPHGHSCSHHKRTA